MDNILINAVLSHRDIIECTFIPKSGRKKIPTRTSAVTDIYSHFPQASGRMVYVFKSQGPSSGSRDKWWEDGCTWDRLNFDQIRIMESGDFINVSKDKGPEGMVRDAVWTTLDPDLVVVAYRLPDSSGPEDGLIPNYEQLAGKSFSLHFCLKSQTLTHIFTSREASSAS